MRGAAAEAAALETDPASPWYAFARASHAAASTGPATWMPPPRKRALPRRPPGRARRSAWGIRGPVLDRGRPGRHSRGPAMGADGSGDRGRRWPGSRRSPAHLPRLHGRRCDFRTDRAARRGPQWVRARTRIRPGRRGISPWHTVEILLRLAPVLFDLGHRSRAAALLAEARSMLVFSPDGAGAQLARLDRIERRLAARPPQAFSPGAPLTEREAAVLRLLGGSLSLREIGQQARPVV